MCKVDRNTIKVQHLHDNSLLLCCVIRYDLHDMKLHHYIVIQIHATLYDIHPLLSDCPLILVYESVYLGPRVVSS